jgi:probable rRNA maturation factor
LFLIAMEPTIIYKQRIPGLSRRGLADFIVKACQAARLRGTVTVMITNNREVQALNSRFKGADRPTDVLSFPAPVFVRGFAGDIAISADIASQNARALGHRCSDEVRILALHGILHLAGYDHEDDRGEMARTEQLLRQKLDLPAGLIERSGDSKPATAARRARAGK